MFEDTKTWEVLNLLGVDAKSKGRAPLHSTNSILNIERCPAIDRLILAKVIRLDEIVDLRNHEATSEFRTWLWSQPDPTNAEEVTEAYAAAVQRGKKVWDRKWFKVARILTMGALGSTAGGLVAGTSGMLGPIAAKGMEMAVSLLDGLVLGALFNGPNPKHFTSEVISNKLIAAAMAARREP